MFVFMFASLIFLIYFHFFFLFIISIYKSHAITLACNENHFFALPISIKFHNLLQFLLSKESLSSCSAPLLRIYS